SGMSVSLEKLRLLKREAGKRDGPARSLLPLAGEAAPKGRMRACEGAAATRAGLPLPLSPDSPSGSDLAGSTLLGSALAGFALPGCILPAPDLPAPDLAKPSIETLRRLLGVRERKPAPVGLPRGAVDRLLPGEEIAPGLRLIETWLPFAAPTEMLPLVF